MTPLQEDALVYLIQQVCTELGIPTGNYSEYWNDYETSHSWIGPNGGIGMHRDISPHNKRMCPGDPYYQGQMDTIIARVNGGSTTLARKEEIDMVQLQANVPVLLCPPPGNSVLEIGVDFSDANVRVAGHVEGATRWEIIEFNTRPTYDQWSKEIGPGKWAVDKVSVEVTQFNPPEGHAATAVIWPA